MIGWLKLNVEWIAAFIFIVGTGWTVIIYFIYRRQEIHQKKFEIYHSLIKDFVQPDKTTGATYQDRQIAIAFELRNFPEYYELSLRLLEGLYDFWKQKDESRNQITRVLDEMKHTIDYIKGKKKYCCFKK